MFMEGFIILWLHMKLKRSLICICPQWGELSMMHRQPEAEGGNPVHRWLDLVGCSYESQSGWMMFAAKNRGSFSVPRHTAARTAGPLLRTLIFSFLACRLTSASWHTVKASYVNLFLFCGLMWPAPFCVCRHRASWGRSSWETSSLTLSSPAGSSTASLAKRCSTETTPWLAGKPGDPF